MSTLALRPVSSTVFEEFFKFLNRPAGPAIFAAAWGAKRIKDALGVNGILDFFGFYSETFSCAELAVAWLARDFS